MRALALVIALATLTFGGIGCFDEPAPACAFRCGENDACPDGYTCRGDGYCKRKDIEDDFVCVPGATADAAAPDAVP